MKQRFAGVMVLLLLSSSAYADRVYKWQDENGQTHYSSQPPPSAARPADKVMDFTRMTPEERENAELRGKIHQLEAEQALQRNRTEPSAQQQAPAPAGPSQLSWDDRNQIENIQREIARLNESRIGSAGQRQSEVDALTRQMELIYGKYGVVLPPSKIVIERRHSVTHDSERNPGAKERDERDRKAREVELEYQREKRFQEIGVLGREGRYNQAVKDCNFTSGAICR